MANPKSSSTKTGAKSAVAKPAVPAKSGGAAKVKVVAKAKPPAKAEAIAKLTTRKAAVDKPPAKAPAKAKAKKPAAAATRQVKAVSSEQRRYYVEVAAYHIAERRGFAAGNPLDDWVQAETEIDRLLSAGKLGG